MKDNTAIVVTSIAAPNEALKAVAAGCKKNKYQFILIGDEASPADFSLEGCDFYSLDRQIQTGLKFAKNCPVKRYARKNIGYLLAIQNGAEIIIETDDDNIPYETFFSPRRRTHNTAVVENAGWVNAYRYFTDANIWPRGFALEHLRDSAVDIERLKVADIDCPIQQGLVNDNPDVDAIYRLTGPLPVRFANNRPVAVGAGCWCPFNSQSTAWFADAYELLYLPAYCSFRMTDIWRSFIAQKICHLNSRAILFHSPAMTQHRNIHNLLKDFADEIPGYLNNSAICDALDELSLKSGEENIPENLRLCYERLIEMKLIGPEELSLLDDWLSDLAEIQAS